MTYLLIGKVFCEGIKSLSDSVILVSTRKRKRVITELNFIEISFSWNFSS